MSTFEALKAGDATHGGRAAWLRGTLPAALGGLSTYSRPNSSPVCVAFKPFYMALSRLKSFQGSKSRAEARADVHHRDRNGKDVLQHATGETRELLLKALAAGGSSRSIWSLVVDLVDYI